MLSTFAITLSSVLQYNFLNRKFQHHQRTRIILCCILLYFNIVFLVFFSFLSFNCSWIFFCIVNAIDNHATITRIVWQFNAAHYNMCRAAELWEVAAQCLCLHTRFAVVYRLSLTDAREIQFYVLLLFTK